MTKHSRLLESVLPAAGADLIGPFAGAHRTSAELILSVAGAHARQRDDLRLAGTVASVILENELTIHLNALSAQGIRTIRNGKLHRNIATIAGIMPFTVARERTGTFEPKLLPRYVRSTDIDPSDLLAFAVSSGYSRRELRTLLLEAYACSGEIPSAFEQIFSATIRTLQDWLAATASTHIMLLVGWTKVVQHRCNIEKRIVGVKMLGIDGRLTGVRAIAGRPNDTEALCQRLICELMDDLGVKSPTHCLLPKELKAFAEIAQQKWPASRIDEIQD